MVSAGNHVQGIGKRRLLDEMLGQALDGFFGKVRDLHSVRGHGVRRQNRRPAAVGDNRDAVTPRNRLMTKRLRVVEKLFDGVHAQNARGIEESVGGHIHSGQARGVARRRARSGSRAA